MAFTRTEARRAGREMRILGLFRGFGFMGEYYLMKNNQKNEVRKKDPSKKKKRKKILQ